MEDERFVTALAKELWHTHIPYANHVFEKYYSVPEMNSKHGYYLETFHIDGQFGEDKQCVDTQMNNSTQQTCLFRYNDHEKYINKVKSMQWPILQAFNRTNRTIPAFLLTSNVTDVTNYKKSIVLKDRVDDINNKVDNGVDNGIGIGIGKRMMMVTDATPDYHFYADIPKGLNQQFPTSKIVLINRHMLHRAISTYRYVMTNGMVDPNYFNLTEFVNVVKEHKGEFDGCVAARNKYRKGGNGNSKDNVNEFVLQETNQHWMYHLGNISKYPPGYLDSIKHSKEHGVYRKYMELFDSVNKITNPCHFQPFIANHNNIFSRYYIYSHMKWWLQFYKPEQILVIDYEMLAKKPKYVINKVLNFLELSDSTSIPDYIYDIQFSGPTMVEFRKDKIKHLKRPVLASTRLPLEYLNIMSDFHRQHSENISNANPNITSNPIIPNKSLNMGELILNEKHHYKFLKSTITYENIEVLNNLFHGYDYKTQMKNIAHKLKIQCI